MIQWRELWGRPLGICSPASTSPKYSIWMWAPSPTFWNPPRSVNWEWWCLACVWISLGCREGNIRWTCPWFIADLTSYDFLLSISDSSFFPSCQVAQIQFRPQIGLQRWGLWDVSLSDCTSIQLTGPGMFWIIRNLVSLLQNPILNWYGSIWHLRGGMCQTSNISLITIWHNVELLASCWCIIIRFSLLRNRNFIFYGFGTLGCRRESQG